MQELFDLAFARLSRASDKRSEFGSVWSSFIEEKPWTIDLLQTSPTDFEFFASQTTPAPAELSLVFSEWLAAIRAALDNGFYAWVSAATGQNPPPQAGRLQYPICASAAEFKRQKSRLSAVPIDIVKKLELVQPYMSPDGPESNLFYWVNELARTDRHRTPHIGIGRIAEHRVRLALPSDVTVIFDERIRPFQALHEHITICRFTTSRPISPADLEGSDFRGIGIDPEIHAWANYNIDGKTMSLHKRMSFAELFARRDLESMAAYAKCSPKDGFRVIQVE